MLSGVLYGLGACVLWGFVYLVPLVLPDYDPVIIATAATSVSAWWRFL